MTGHLLFWAAAPAMVMSAWLLHVSQAPRSAQAMQFVVAGIASAAFLVFARGRSLGWYGHNRWLALILVLSLFIPLLTSLQGGPERWLDLGSARLYVAPVVLPAVLFLLEALMLRAPGVAVATVSVASIALVLQPDAAQMSALAMAILVLLFATNSPLLLRLALLAVLLTSGVAAWCIPDPLAPVPYVEGVFSVAYEVSPFVLAAALMCAAIPVIALVWAAWVTRSSGMLAVAAYYAFLFALAPLQITPVPLLGFGAGPILGYLFVAGLVLRPNANQPA